METLVLDAGYQPKYRTSWQTAIVNVLVDKVARVVEEYPDKYIRTVSPIEVPGLTSMPYEHESGEVRWQVAMPSVIALIKTTPRRRAVKFSRYGVYMRDGGKCQYCGRHVSRSEFTYEHVVPRVQGGHTNWANVVVACVPCNQRKAGRTPEQAKMKLLSVPQRPKHLPDVQHGFMQFSPGMPDAWRNYLRDVVYWQSELEND